MIVTHGDIRRVRHCTALVLSVCIVLFALGIPTTLFSVHVATDLVTATILEGLSLATSVHYWQQLTTVSTAVERTFSIDTNI
jgi:uncharacterized membrane protein YhfC